MRCLEVGIMDLVRVVAYSVESVDRISTESDIFQLLMSVSELSIAHSSCVRTKPGQERRLIRRVSTYTKQGLSQSNRDRIANRSKYRDSKTWTIPVKIISKDVWHTFIPTNSLVTVTRSSVNTLTHNETPTLSKLALV